MLGRKCRFHDLAFFDPVIFESLRQLVIDAENKVRTRSFQRCFLYLRCIHCHRVYLSPHRFRASPTSSICSPSPSGDMTGCCGPKVHSSVSICPSLPPSSIQKVTDFPLLFLWRIPYMKFTCLATPLYVVRLQHHSHVFICPKVMCVGGGSRWKTSFVRDTSDIDQDGWAASPARRIKFGMTYTGRSTRIFCTFLTSLCEEYISYAL